MFYLENVGNEKLLCSKIPGRGGADGSTEISGVKKLVKNNLNKIADSNFVFMVGKL